MQKSMVTNFFVICMTAIAAGILCISSVMLVVATEFYKSEKKEALLANMQNVIGATKLYSITSAERRQSDELRRKYESYSYASNSAYLLFDEVGHVLMGSGIKREDTNITTKKIYIVNLESFRSLPNQEYYFSIGNFNGLYKSSYINMLVPFEHGGGKYYLLCSTASEPLYSYVKNLAYIIIVVSLAVLVLFGVVLYYATKKMLNPLKEMTLAAKKYGRGDFTVQIDTSYSGEMGTLAATLNDMSYSLSMLENTRKSFIANVSHELKTPMTTIGGFVDGILDGTIPPEEEKHYLKIVSLEVNRLARLVRSMLNIAKYETGEIQMVKAKFDIVSLTIKTLLLFESKIEDNNIKIIGLDTEPVSAHADIDLIQQILYNLIENAVKFVNRDGYISFNFSFDDQGTSVSIRNSGEGLTQEELPKVFDRFYKTDESHGKDKTGVGLGLSIVRSIINLHEGTILVKSKKGEYTEFTFTIPNT